jgi:ABC-2 type transport system ATP-binding protein
VQALRAGGEIVVRPPAQPRDLAHRPTPGPITAPTGAIPVTGANTTEFALVTQNLTKRFGNRTAVDSLSLSVAKGEVFGFLGPNGAGKTTTVRMLGTLIAPSSGSAVVAGLPLSPANGVEIRQRISIMPESPGLYLRLSVEENLECFAGLYGLGDAPQRVQRALEAVSMAGRARDTCGTLSKGLRQRVGLARTLLNDPQVVFLDEPTSGLDPVASREVHDLIDGLRRQGVTIFLTTHRLEEAERLCDRVAIFSTTLRSVGRPDELRDRLFKKEISVETVAPLASPEAIFGSVPSVDGWSGEGSSRYLLSVADTRAAAPEVARALVRAGADVLSIAVSRHSLEDVYMELVDEDVEVSRR